MTAETPVKGISPCFQSLMHFEFILVSAERSPVSFTPLISQQIGLLQLATGLRPSGTHHQLKIPLR